MDKQEYKQKINEAWEDSGLSKYFERMAQLKEIGYVFAKDGVMEEEDLIKVALICGDRKITDVPIEEFKK